MLTTLLQAAWTTVIGEAEAVAEVLRGAAVEALLTGATVVLEETGIIVLLGSAEVAAAEVDGVTVCLALPQA